LRDGGGGGGGWDDAFVVASLAFLSVAASGRSAVRPVSDLESGLSRGRSELAASRRVAGGGGGFFFTPVCSTTISGAGVAGSGGDGTASLDWIGFSGAGAGGAGDVNGSCGGNGSGLLRSLGDLA
jgi:hypothetical protein